MIPSLRMGIYEEEQALGEGKNDELGLDMLSLSTGWGVQVEMSSAIDTGLELRREIRGKDRHFGIRENR